jgi:colanic acid biosynthesis glycosyl transferase WcaI
MLQKRKLFFPNWVDTKEFYPLLNRTEIKVKWGYQPTDLICLYSGSIGEKQGLENIIAVAEMLRDNTQVKFIICGTGPYKEKLAQLAETKGLNNVNFMPLQDKAVFNEFLNLADLHLVLQKGNAGDLVMPSKLTTILAVGGVSVVTTSPGTSLYDVVDKFKVGFIVPPDDVMQLYSAIVTAADRDLAPQRESARAYAVQYLNIDNVMQRFLTDIGSN